MIRCKLATFNQLNFPPSAQDTKTSGSNFSIYFIFSDVEQWIYLSLSLALFLSSPLLLVLPISASEMLKSFEESSTRERDYTPLACVCCRQLATQFASMRLNQNFRSSLSICLATNSNRIKFRIGTWAEILHSKLQSSTREQAKELGGRNTLFWASLVDSTFSLSRLH